MIWSVFGKCQEGLLIFFFDGKDEGAIFKFHSSSIYMNIGIMYDRKLYICISSLTIKSGRLLHVLSSQRNHGRHEADIQKKFARYCLVLNHSKLRTMTKVNNDCFK